MNQQQNIDGSDDNRSWNCGEEGATSSPEIEALRARQIRNLLALTLLSVGTPFLLMGDEVRRTQYGNNNAYCQNNTISWFDWNLCEEHRDLFKFVQQLIQLRKHFSRGLNGNTLSLTECIERARVRWTGVDLSEPDLSDDSHSLAATAYLESGNAFHIMLNFYWEPLDFAIPPATEPMHPWFKILDTYEMSPKTDLKSNINIAPSPIYSVGPRSIVLLGDGSLEL